MAYKLYKENIATNPTFQYVDEAGAPGGYTQTDDPIDWDIAYKYIKDKSILTMFADWRAKIDAAYTALGSPSTNQTKIASKWFVIDKATRDTVHTAAEQEIYALFVANELAIEKADIFRTEVLNAIKDASASVVTDCISEHGTPWVPNSIPLGSVLVAGATFFINGGAGVYMSLSGSADDTFFFNDHLSKSGAPKYDGSDLRLKMHCRLSSNGGVGDNVKLNIGYAMVADGDNSTTTVTNLPEQTVDVSAELQDIEFDIVSGIMSGVVGAHNIMIDVSRNSTGAGADTYAGNLEITALEWVKL